MNQTSKQTKLKLQPVAVMSCPAENILFTCVQQKYVTP